MDAYDYDKQEWVTGREGDALMLAQTREELALLTDPAHRESYAKMIGLRPEHVDSYIATMQAQEKRLAEVIGE